MTAITEQELMQRNTFSLDEVSKVLLQNDRALLRARVVEFVNENPGAMKLEAIEFIIKLLSND